MASAEGLKRSVILIAPAADKSASTAQRPISATWPNSPFGTSIVDVADPKNPKLLSHIEMPEGTHSHKVHAQGDLMVRNHELIGPGKPDDFHTGVGCL